MNKEMSERQMSGMKKEILSDIQRALDEEMGKPIKKRDTERITKLNEMIFELTCADNEIVRKSFELSKNELLNKLSEPTKPNHIKLYKRLSVITTCLMIILGVNMASLKVFGQNMFSATYQLAKGGITINTTQTENNRDASVSESDPYGMKAKCAEYGFFPDTPSYIPEGFELVNVFENSNESFDDIEFYYKKDGVKLNFYFTHYKEEIPPIGIPTDTYNVIEDQVNGYKTYILKEEKQFTAIYIDKGILHNIFSENLPYEECQRILESFT